MSSSLKSVYFWHIDKKCTFVFGVSLQNGQFISQIMTFRSRHFSSESSKYPSHTDVVTQTKIRIEYQRVFDIKEIVRFQSRMPVLFKTLYKSSLKLFSERFYIPNTLHPPPKKKKNREREREEKHKNETYRTFRILKSERL